MSESERHLDAIGMMNAGQRHVLVLPGAWQLTLDLAPSVRFDEPLHRGRIARIVDLDPEAVALLVDLPQQLHAGGVERRDAANGGERV